MAESMTRFVHLNQIVESATSAITRNIEFLSEIVHRADKIRAHIHEHWYLLLGRMDGDRETSIKTLRDLCQFGEGRTGVHVEGRFFEEPGVETLGALDEEARHIADRASRRRDVLVAMFDEFLGPKDDWPLVPGPKRGDS